MMMKAIDKIIREYNLPSFFKKGTCLLTRSLDYRYYGDFSKSLPFLEIIRDKHSEERCFVVGMGPSLNHTNFSLIRDEHFICVNNFYTGLDKFGINPQYWCVADGYVMTKHWRQILKLDATLFLTDKAVRFYMDKFYPFFSSFVVPIKPLGHMNTWHKSIDNFDLTKGAYGGTVTFFCLQLAFHLGFKEVYLIGLDCTTKKGIHFDGNTRFKGGTENWERDFKMYDIFKRIYERNDRHIYNSTVGGDLEVFERIKLEDLNGRENEIR